MEEIIAERHSIDKKICSICQSEIEQAGIIEECKHQYCLECIKTWGTTCANTCPLCKVRFNSVQFVNERGEKEVFRVLNRNLVPDQDNAILAQIDDSQDFCYICNSDRNPH